jgi:hypothetical protein
LSEGEISPTTQQDNPPGCPSLGFLYGFVDVNDDSRSSATALLCYQRMQQLPVDASLSFPDLSLSPDSPPVADETKSTLLVAGPNNNTAFQYRLQVHMDKEFSMFNQTEFGSSSSGSNPVVDPFFQGVLFGRRPIPQPWLADPSQHDNVVSAIQGFYRRYMAQAISANMRVPALAANADVLNGTLRTVGETMRVKQHNGSKLALQVILGVMFICGILAASLSKLREVVPHNPCTIAGAMVLWAGSKSCSDRSGVCSLPNDALCVSDKQLVQDDTLAGCSFRLGWWENEGAEKRYGLDIDIRYRAEGQW